MYESASFHYCEGDLFDLFTFHTLCFYSLTAYECRFTNLTESVIAV